MSVFAYQDGVSNRPQSQITFRNLSQNEIQCLNDILGNNCVALAVGVAQILHGSSNTWEKHACGVLCFIKDYNQRIYCFRLYDLRSRQSIYEEIVTSSLRLKKMHDLFYIFNGMHCTVGINFADPIEAETFCSHFHAKQESRQNKKINHESHNKQQTTTMNGVNVSSTSITTSKKKSSSKTSGHGKKKNNRPVISEPDISSFSHVVRIRPGEHFCADVEQRKFFEEVLSGMRISGEDKQYIQQYVEDTDGGLGKLFPPIDEGNIQEQQMSSTKIGSHDNPNNRGDNGRRVPHQDISPPSSIYQQKRRNQSQLQNNFNRSTESNQPTPPAVSPKPAPHRPDDIHPRIHAPPPPTSQPMSTNSQNSDVRRAPAPPPPKPANLQNTSVHSPPPAKPAILQNPGIRLPPPPLPKPTNLRNPGVHSPLPPPPPMPANLQNPGVHSPPPPPPPMPANLQNPGVFTPPPPSIFFPEEMTSELPTSSSDSQRDYLLNDISNFNKCVLKPASQQRLEYKLSYEEKIREILIKRRPAIMKEIDDDDKSDSNDSEWDD